MGNLLDKPETTKHSIKGAGNKLRYGASSMQGWRTEMEDAHTAVVGLPNLKDFSFFGVFDGHAGDTVSNYSAGALLQSILKTNEFKQCMNYDNIHEHIDYITRGLKRGFLNCDDELRNVNGLKSGEDESGSTATTVMVTKDHVFFANLGDSRSLICTAGKCKFATADHKPANPEEKSRIERAGGEVMIGRVNGDLAVSRALGDFEYKNVKQKGQCEQLVSPEPEITWLQRTPEDEFLVLACDGIWDVMTNDMVCSMVRERMKVTDDLEEISSQILDACLRKESKDNMSLMIVAFEAAPKVDLDYKKHDETVDGLLKTSVKEILENTAPPHDFTAVFGQLLKKRYEGLPPWGILVKSAKIEEYFNLYRVPDDNGKR